MKKFYQVVFCWKKPLGKRYSYSNSPFLFSSADEADEYGSAMVNFGKEKSSLYKYRHTDCIVDYSINILVHEECSNLLKGGD